MNEPKNIHDGLRLLNVLVASVAHDIEKFLEAPEEFNSAEYFADVLEAANEAQDLVVHVRGKLK